MPPYKEFSILLFTIIIIIYIFVYNDYPNINGVLIFILILTSIIFLFHKWYFQMMHMLSYSNSVYHIRMLS